MTHLDPQATIAAIASAPGPAARGIIRVSGPRAWEVAASDFRGGTRPRHAAWQAGCVRLEAIGRVLPAALAFWPAPRTYTGQDLAELHTVGSPPLLETLLAQVLARGARPAEPGEFTLRAFLAGRIDLTRAEAVADVVAANGRAQLDAALERLAGGIAGPIEGLRDRLLDLLAQLEAELDFGEEPDVYPMGRGPTAAALARGAEELVGLARRLADRDRPESAPRVVLVGPPNAGKSRLFNALVGRERAIVSPLAGTTRDYLSAVCTQDGLTFELVDTAGIDDARDAIAGRAQAHTAGQAEAAVLVLACCPAGAGWPEDWPAASGEVLRVTTKCDLGPPSPGAIATSALTGAGIEELRAAIASALRSLQPADATSSTGARCRDSLTRAAAALARAAAAIPAGGGDELVALDLREAIDELGRVVGAVVTDDILDRIFRRFCIGK